MHRIDPVIGARGADHRSCAHRSSKGNGDRPQIRVRGPHPTAMVHGDAVASSHRAGERDNPGCDNPYRRTRLRRYVQPPMAAVGAQRSKGPHHPPGHRPVPAGTHRRGRGDEQRRQQNDRYHEVEGTGSHRHHLEACRRTTRGGIGVCGGRPARRIPLPASNPIAAPSLHVAGRRGGKAS
jgi:hypothetical protein